jgi:hypothetical protein
VDVPARRRWIDPVAAVLLGALAALVVRERLDVLTRNTVWAEDARNFLGDRLALGPFALLHPYQGYLHLVPRGLTDVAVALVPLDRYAVAVTVLSSLTVGAVAAGIVVLARDAVPSLPLRLLLAMVPAIVPQAPVEVAGNFANLHWYLLVLAPWLFAARMRSWWAGAGFAVVALLVTLTEIQTALFLPLLLVGIRDRRKVPLVVAAVGGVVAQVVTTLTHPRIEHATAVESPADVVTGFLLHPFAGALTWRTTTIGRLVVDHGIVVLAVPAVVLALLWVWAGVLAGWRTRIALLAMAAGAVGVWSASVVLNGNVIYQYARFTDAELLSLTSTRYGVATAMFVLAGTVVAASVLVRGGRHEETAGHAERRGHAARSTVRVVSVLRQVVGWLLVLVVVSAGVLSFRVGTTQRDVGPNWDVEVDQGAATCPADDAGSFRVTAAPNGATWFVDVPCADVR